MRGDTNFKGSDSSGLSVYFYSVVLVFDVADGFCVVPESYLEFVGCDPMYVFVSLLSVVVISALYTTLA